MTRSLKPLLGLALVVPLVAGCGSSGGPEGNPPAGETVSVGPLQAEVDSAAAFQTTMLTSPGTSSIAFAALHGTRIVRLQQIGYGRLAYGSRRSGNPEIHVTNLDGSGTANLTRDVGQDFHPSWSPDGARIAFYSDRDGNWEIYAMNADGSGQTRLTTDPADDYEPEWCPDGSRIAFTSDRDGVQQVFVMEADGTGQTQLTDSSSSSVHPSWSPDGKQMAFCSSRGSDTEIYVMNADGTGQTNVTRSPAVDWEPSWSPDGSRIAFCSFRDGGGEIYVMGADGSGQTRLTDSPGSNDAPSWSPDGKRIAFCTDRDLNYEVYVMDADGSGQTNVTRKGSADTQPSWSPKPSVLRSLIGATGSDGDKNPPFGAARPLVVVGLDPGGLVSATTIGMNEPNWPTLRVTALQDIGNALAGAKITGSNIRSVIEDMGCGLAPRVWDVFGSPTTSAVLVFWSGETGKVSSVLATSDTALFEAPAALSGGRVVVRGSFAGVYSAADPGRNLVSDSATQVTLDGRTGEVIAAN